jgi:hypothetical protein
VVLGVTGGVLLLVVVAVVVAAMTHGGSAATSPHPAAATVAAPGGQLPTQIVPDAKAGKAPRVGAGGKSVTFYWTNPAPRPGDQYLWYREATNVDPQISDVPHATLTGIDPHQQVCIDVMIKRNGKTSADPLQECN